MMFHNYMATEGIRYNLHRVASTYFALTKSDLPFISGQIINPKRPMARNYVAILCYHITQPRMSLSSHKTDSQNCLCSHSASM